MRQELIAALPGILGAEGLSSRLFRRFDHSARMHTLSQASMSEFLWIITFLVVLLVGQFTAILILLLRLTESRGRAIPSGADRPGLAEVGRDAQDTSGALAGISTPLSKPEARRGLMELWMMSRSLDAQRWLQRICTPGT